MESRDYFIDITRDVCPFTFVKTKLLLERMPVGAIATVRLKGELPLDNVPRSLRAHGHEIISLVSETPGIAGADTDFRQPHILTVRKAESAAP